MKSYTTLAILLLISIGFAQDVIVIENDTTTESTQPTVGDQFGNLFSGTWNGLGDIFNSGFTGDSALLLISGGLFILLFVVPLAMINSVFWKKKSDLHTTSFKIGDTAGIGHRYDIGFSTGSSLRASNMDEVIDTLKYLEDVDVKIVNSTTSLKRIKVKGCRACHNKTSKKPLCEFERGFFAGALNNLYKSVDVKEVACKAQGNDWCEFEVKLKR